MAKPDIQAYGDWIHQPFVTKRMHHGRIEDGTQNTAVHPIIVTAKSISRSAESYALSALPTKREVQAITVIRATGKATCMKFRRPGIRHSVILPVKRTVVQTQKSGE